MALLQKVVMEQLATMTQPYPPSGIAVTEYGALSGGSLGSWAKEAGWDMESDGFTTGVGEATQKLVSSMRSSVVVVVDMLNES
jgi:hypothetical protein